MVSIFTGCQCVQQFTPHALSNWIAMKKHGRVQRTGNDAPKRLCQWGKAEVAVFVFGKYA